MDASLTVPKSTERWGGVFKDDFYRLRASLNRGVVDGRERVAAQELRVLQRDGLPACGVAVGLLGTLDRSGRLMTRAQGAGDRAAHELVIS